MLKTFSFIDGNCGGAVSGQVINYPANGSYPPNARCQWTVRRNPPFRLQFLRFDLEYHRSCAYDWLQVDGGTKMCGNRQRDILITNPSMVIDFHSDGVGDGTGFKINILNISNILSKHIFIHPPFSPFPYTCTKPSVRAGLYLFFMNFQCIKYYVLCTSSVAKQILLDL